MNSQVSGGRKGGKNRAKTLSAKKRSEIARLGGQAKAEKVRTGISLPVDTQVEWAPLLRANNPVGLWTAHAASVPEVYGLGRTEEKALADLREALKELNGR